LFQGLKGIHVLAAAEVTVVTFSGFVIVAKNAIPIYDICQAILVAVERRVSNLIGLLPQIALKKLEVAVM
jgi:hypothetical protein